jgi:phosphatidylserine decarboxylase
MTLHREGRISIILALIILILITVLLIITPISVWLKIVILAPFIVLFGLILWFFRLPARTAIPDDSVIYAPADGKIVVIEKTREPEYFKDERIQVSIFMSPLNVHQNVYPISGEVSYTQYHKGDYLVAWHPKSSTQNERSTVVIRHNNGTEILVRQIAGAVARRICTYSKVGDRANQGSEFGFIKFGSRVDIFLPLNAKLECILNQKSINKETIIARLS